MKKYIYILIAVLLSSCSLWQPKHREGVAVELNGQILTFEQLDAITRTALTPEDSAKLVQAYIYQWATDILEYAEARDRADSELEKLVEDYRRTLYIHEYEQKLMTRHQPASFPDSIVEGIYEERKEHMRLKESIVEGVLLIVPQATPKLAQVKTWMSKLDEANIEKIEKYAFQYATGYEYFPNQWRTSTQIILRLPLENNTLDEKMKKQSQIVVEDSTSVYILQVTDKRFEGDIMPLEFARDEIYQTLMNDWKIGFLNSERQQLYDEAVRYDKLKQYDK